LLYEVERKKVASWLGMAIPVSARSRDSAQASGRGNIPATATSSASFERPDSCSCWTLAHDLDVSDTRVTRLRGWSGITVWRFERIIESPAFAGLSSFNDPASRRRGFGTLASSQIG
jgi:hypothetical protein